MKNRVLIVAGVAAVLFAGSARAAVNDCVDYTSVVEVGCVSSASLTFTNITGSPGHANAPEGYLILCGCDTVGASASYAVTNSVAWAAVKHTCLNGVPTEWYEDWFVKPSSGLAWISNTFDVQAYYNGGEWYWQTNGLGTSWSGSFTNAVDFGQILFTAWGEMSTNHPCYPGGAYSSISTNFIVVGVSGLSPSFPTTCYAEDSSNATWYVEAVSTNWVWSWDGQGNPVLVPPETNAIVCASASPWWLPETNLPPCWQVSGGGPVLQTNANNEITTNRLCATVDVSALASYVVTAASGCLVKTNTIIVVKADIEQTNVFACPGKNYEFALTGDSSEDVTWEISPTNAGWASFSTNGNVFRVVGTNQVTVNAGTNCQVFTITAVPTQLTNTYCGDTATLSVFALEDLTVSGATRQGTNEPAVYVFCPGAPGTTIPITANVCQPGGAELTNMPCQVEWTGAQGTTNPLIATVDGSTVASNIVQCKVGTMTQTVIIDVGDHEAPTLVASNPTVGTDYGQCSAVVWLEGWAWAWDNCSGVTLTFNPGSGTAFPKGTTNVTVTAEDDYGNSTNTTIVVTVLDQEAPVISGCPSDISTCPSTNGTNIVTWTAPTATDNCPGVTMTSNHASGENFPLGETTVTYTATDSSGNQSTCSFKVKVEDLEPPTITCPEDITLCADPSGTNIVTWTPPTATDNCAVTNITCNPTNGSNFPVGETTVTCTATDVGGNTNSCTFKVRVFGIPQAFRDAACTKALDDWPATTNQFRSPKYIFGKEDDIYIQVNGPSDLGNDRLEALVTSESYGPGVYLKLHEVSSGVYRNTTTYPSRALRLGDHVFFETGHVAITIIDEELLTFSLVVDGNSMGCSTNVMVDRGEWLAVAGSEDESRWVQLYDDFNANLVDARSGLNSIWKWWENGYFLGKEYDGPATTQTDEDYEEAKVAALTAGAANGYSPVDMILYSGHGGGGTLAPCETVDNAAFGVSQTWGPDSDGSQNTWGREVEFFVANGCEQLGDATGATNFVARWMLLFGSGIHGVLGTCDQVSAGALNDDFGEFVDVGAGGMPLVNAWMSACLNGWNTPYGILVRTNYLLDRYNEVGRDIMTVAGTYNYYYYNGNLATYSHASRADAQHEIESASILQNIKFSDEVELDLLNIEDDENDRGLRLGQLRKHFGHAKAIGRSTVGWSGLFVTNAASVQTRVSADDAKNAAANEGFPIPADFVYDSDAQIKLTTINQGENGPVEMSEPKEIARIFNFVRVEGGNKILSGRCLIALHEGRVQFVSYSNPRIEKHGTTKVKKAELVSSGDGYPIQELKLDLVYVRSGASLKPCWRVMHERRAFLFDAATGKLHL